MSRGLRATRGKLAKTGKVAPHILPHIVGETTITAKNQVSLPAHGVQELGWAKGDRLLVEVLGNDIMVLLRRPASWTDAFAGRLTGIYGHHDEVLRYLEAERRSWESEP